MGNKFLCINIILKVNPANDLLDKVIYDVQKNKLKRTKGTKK